MRTSSGGSGGALPVREGGEGARKPDGVTVCGHWGGVGRASPVGGGAYTLTARVAGAGQVVVAWTEEKARCGREEKRDEGRDGVGRGGVWSRGWSRQKKTANGGGRQRHQLRA